MPEKFPIVSVTQLNKHVKSYLENELGIVHVDGELSNLSKPASGHLYFTLKDATAQIKCVFFKNRHSNSFETPLRDGQQVLVTGRVSLYEARGDYQLLVEELKESGLGALYKRFEALKNKLAEEGLFLQSRKKPLPIMPKTIGIITSTTGAAIQDILSTLARRFPLADVIVYPSEVQGATASEQLITALHCAQKDGRCDVIILARGGGSLEDLWAFNDESLARTIAACVIPIVTGVGHETDFTIADFVADHRAETPTAAATIITPNCADLLSMQKDLLLRLQQSMNRYIQNYHLRLGHLYDKITSPKYRLEKYWQTLDYLEKSLVTSINHIIRLKKNQLQLHSNQLHAQHPRALIQRTKSRLVQLQMQLIQIMIMTMNNHKFRLNKTLATLHAVSPLATLDRGYAIATKKHKILHSTKQLQIGDAVGVRIAKGRFECQVTQIIEESHD